MLVLEIRDPRGALLQPLQPAEQTCGTAKEPARRGVGWSLEFQAICSPFYGNTIWFEFAG